MCTIANVIKGVVGVAGVAISAARNYNEQKDTLNYRTSLALNNMKEAKENAYAQKQLGIEEARKQKIEGIKRAKELIAQNAAGGFSFDSGNNLYNYNDEIDATYQDAYNSQQQYNIRADNYFEKARAYLNEAKNYQQEKKDLKHNFFSTSLGSTRSVANKWFS